jgi:diguanylate cyclase (GGDEF)-like protein
MPGERNVDCQQPEGNHMNENVMQDIVKLCLEIDKAACTTYEQLATVATEPRLKLFWEEMQAEESQHVDFWERALRHSQQSPLPQLFDAPEVVITELQNIIPKVNELLARSADLSDSAESLLLAYRFEFYLLHPAFGTLFKLLRKVIGGICPEDGYEQHIQQFVDIMMEYGKATPTLELLAETLKRLWKETRDFGKLTSTDSLTELLTRRAFTEIAEYMSYLAKRNDTHVCLLILDLDHFKHINDNHGHQAGDEVLRSVGRTIKKALRQSDVAGRYGGEEFVVFMPETTPEKAPEIAERLRRLIADIQLSDHNVTCSIGGFISNLNSYPALSLDDMIGRADKALYLAKASGRNCVKFASDMKTTGKGGGDFAALSH